MMKFQGTTSSAAMGDVSNILQIVKRRRYMAGAMGAILICAAAAAPSEAQAATCESLATTKLPNATVLSAVTVSGTVKGPDGKNYSNMPSFCNVAILATPSGDSAINILLWMPSANWNGRFEGTGNGGYAGNMAIEAPSMVYAIQHRMAVAATDMGTAPSGNSDGDPLIGHPQKWIDWGYRATHVMTEVSKDVLRVFYGRGPHYSYFNGCSTGGQQALMTAQRYPADYNGILGGDPANDRTHVHTSVLWNYVQMHKSPANYLTSDQVKLITDSVLKACVLKAGGVAGDTFLTDPVKCNWQPSSIQCSRTGQTNCLSAQQVAVVNAIYGGPRDPVTHGSIYPGAIRGAENATMFGWNNTQSSTEPPFGSLFKWVFGPQFQASQFDFHQGMREVDQILSFTLNANSPNLSAFQGRRGKLMMYHGWADPLVPPQTSTNYFNSVVKAQGNGTYSAAALAKTQGFYRLFMVPGMNHCAGGPGPNAFGNQFSGTIAVTDPPSNDAQHHALTALIEWVEAGKAPNQIIATKFVNDLSSQGIAMQRPLCVYPKVAHYSGHGSSNVATSFVCK